MDIGDRIYRWIMRPETPIMIKLRIQAEDVIALVAEFREVENDALERAARVLDDGSFLHTSAPAAVWAREVSALIRALKTEVKT